MIIISILFGSGIVCVVLGCIWWHRDRDRSKQMFTIALALVPAIVAIWVSNRSLDVAKEQLSLQLRPFIAVINSNYMIEYDSKADRYWIQVKYELKK